MFFKHKYLTSPIITPADRIVATAEQLTAAAAGISKGESKEMEELKAFAESLKKG